MNDQFKEEILRIKTAISEVMARDLETYSKEELEKFLLLLQNIQKELAPFKPLLKIIETAEVVIPKMQDILKSK